MVIRLLAHEVVVHGLICYMACGIFLEYGLSPCTPVLEGGSSTTEPPGKSPLVYFCFVFTYTKISLPRPMQRRFSSAFTSRSFMGLGLTFKSLIRINICGWCYIGVQYHSCTCGYPVFSTPFIEKTVLSPFCVLGSLSKIG